MLNFDHLKKLIELAWQEKEQGRAIEPYADGILQVIEFLGDGRLKVSEKTAEGWVSHPWIKKAILLYFKLQPMHLVENGGLNNYDKIPLKTAGWRQEEFVEAGFRSVPGSIVRAGAFIDKDAVLMPSYVNIGAHVGKGTMIDTWATVGTCAYIGANCHISGGVGIGGVLEPLQATPVIIEDNCFIGARSEIAEGVIVEEGSVISMGVFIGASTKIINRATGEIIQGRVPAYSVVVPGTQTGANGINLACAVIVKQVDARTRSKTAINDLLRQAA